MFYKLFSFYWASSPDSLSITKVKSLNITLLLNLFCNFSCLVNCAVLIIINIYFSFSLSVIFILCGKM